MKIEKERHYLMNIIVTFNPQEADFYWAWARLDDEEFNTAFELNYNLKYIYVISVGKDCDGYQKFLCHSYPTAIEALEASSSHNEDSDGIIWNVVNMKAAKEYCRDYNKDFNDYK